MTLNEYQDLAQRTSNRALDIKGHLFNGVLGLTGEAGECADLLKKHYYQDGRNFVADLEDELGDCLWYVVETATAMGLTLEDVARHNIEKLIQRYPDGFSADRSLHREG